MPSRAKLFIIAIVLVNFYCLGLFKTSMDKVVVKRESSVETSTFANLPKTRLSNNNSSTSSNSTHQLKTPVSILEELLRKRGSSPKYEIDQTLTFKVTVTADGFKNEGVGEGKSKREAKQAAAKSFLDSIAGVTIAHEFYYGTLKNIQSNPTNASTEATKPSKATYVSPYEFNLTMGNYIGALQSYCDIKKLPHPKCELETETGNAHQKEFNARCSLGDESTTGTASSLKTAKQKAAKAMWDIVKLRLD